MDNESVRTCPRCAEPFTPRRGGKPQLYCSPECRKNGRPTAKRSAICAQCGASFVPTPGAKHQRFCDVKCKAKANNTRHRRALLPLRDTAPVPQTCPQCGDSFLPKNRNRVYCYGKFCAQAAYQSRKAAGDARRVVARSVPCDGCGTAFTAVYPSARWCSKGCANRHWGNVRARQRGQLSSAKYTDLEIFERDGWRCHLCRKPIRRDLPRLDPDGATIDHLIPIARGGLDEPANVAAAHWKCNRAKGIRAMGEQLALI